MNLCSKYKPKYISELEFEYNNIINFLGSNKSFIVNGPKNSGKSTIVKLYLEYLDYDYLLLDDSNISKDDLLENIKFKTKSVFSYFYNKKFIIVIDNFELFNINVRDLIIQKSKKIQFLIITNKYLNTNINFLRINNYSINYLLDLYCIIYFLEKGYNCDYIPEFKTISEMYSILEFNINSNNDNNDYLIIYDNFEYKFNDLVQEQNFEDKLYILDKISSYNIFQYNLIYNFKSIDDLANNYNNLCDSLSFYNNYNLNINLVEYYSILSIIGTSYNLNKFKIHKENFQMKKKINLKYNK